MIILILLVSGCKNYIPYSYIDHVVSMSEVYCRQSALQLCENYRACIANSYNQVKSKAPWILAGSRIIIIQGSPGIMEKGDYTNLIKNSYNLLDQKKIDVNDLDLSVGVSYFIYAHNACSDITGDKVYNIDNYLPLLKNELGISYSIPNSSSTSKH